MQEPPCGSWATENHMWFLSTWNVANIQLYVSIHSLLINLDLKTDIWLYYWDTFKNIVTTWGQESTFSSRNFMISKYRGNLSDETVAPKLRCAVSVQHILDLKTSNGKQLKYLINIFFFDYMSEW